jgi:hypothetical protein
MQKITTKLLIQHTSPTPQEENSASKHNDKTRAQTNIFYERLTDELNDIDILSF